MHGFDATELSARHPFQVLRDHHAHTKISVMTEIMNKCEISLSRNFLDEISAQSFRSRFLDNYEASVSKLRFAFGIVGIAEVQTSFLQLNLDMGSSYKPWLL